MLSRSLLLAPAFFAAACTSVRVDRTTQERFPKVPAKDVRQINAEDAKARRHTILASIAMSTGGRRAADLHELARQRTGKLGGNAYVVTASESHTTMEGGFMSLFGDKTTATLSLDALRWNDQPAAPEPTKPATGKKRRWWWF